MSRGSERKVQRPMSNVQRQNDLGFKIGFDDQGSTFGVTKQFRVQSLDCGFWTLDIGHWTLDIGRWTLDVGHWTFIE
jgi:hypothetical protein